MSIEQIYKLYFDSNEIETPEGGAALDIAGNDDQLDTIAAGLNSSHRAGFVAGFRAAAKLMKEALA